jgi:arsenate reductase
MKIVIYQKPTCTTCREVYKALKESGVDFEAVDYYTDSIPKAKLKELLRKLGMTPRELLRTKDPIYKTLGIADRDPSDAELLDLMTANPDLIQRPIVERGNSAVLARPAERIRAFLAS